MIIKLDGSISAIKREAIKVRAQKILDSDSRICGRREMMAFGITYIIEWGPTQPTIVYPAIRNN